MKTEITSFDVGAIAYELANTIRNSRVENIYQIGQKTLLLKLHTPNQPTRQLLMEAGKRIHLTDYALEKPPSPPAFCMALRKHLSGGVIENIEQHEFERAITFKIRVRDELTQLIVELFGEGNIILAGQDNAIVAAMTFKKMRDRNILRNEIFKHAPASGKNPLLVTRTQLDEVRNLGQLEIVRALARLLSIGGLYAEEILLRANVDKNAPCQAISLEQADAVFSQLQSLLFPLREGKLDPVVAIDDKGEWIDATPIRLKRYESLKTEAYKSFNEALDDYYTRMSHATWISEARREYENELARQQRMLHDQKKTLEDAQKVIARNKRVGDLIYSRLGELQLLQQQIIDAKQRGQNGEQTTGRLEEEKQAGSSPAIYFDSFDAGNQILNVSIEGLTFSIKLNRSVQANATEYYDRMKKAGRKLEGSEKAFKETQRRVEELQEKWIENTEKAKAEKRPKQLERAWYEKFRWFNSSDGFLVLGGRDATTNEILVKKHLEPSDIVFHADIVGAPFVVIKTKGMIPTEQVILEAARFAASYSRAWREMLGVLDVFWVSSDQVSKTSPSGQYIDKGSFIIHGKKNYVRKVVLQTAIGVRLENGNVRVIGGPLDAIREQTNIHVELVPGEQTSAELAKRIRRFLLERTDKEYQERISKIPIEEIQKFIPPGKSAIAKGR